MEQTANIPVQTKSFVCEACGGIMKWNIQNQQFECASCRTPGILQIAVDRVIEHDFEGYAQRDACELSFPDYQTIACQTCGATVTIEKNQTATVCPMCASSQVIPQKQEAGVPPDGIIPFKIDMQQAQQNFRGWVKKLWFAPNKLKQSYQEGKLDGMYLPFWTFDADAVGDYTGRGGNDREVEDEDGKTHTVTDWYSVSGQVSNSYNDYPVPAGDGEPTHLINKILPYNTSEGSLPYSSDYLSGFSAERYTIKADTAFVQTQKHIEGDLRSRADSDILSRGFDKADVNRIDVTYYNVKYKHVLVPAWVSAFSYGSKRYTYMINGETGAVGGERPYSIPKIAAAIAVGVGIIVGIFALFSLGDNSEETQYTELSNKSGYVYEHRAQDIAGDEIGIQAYLQWDNEQQV